jgi:hypothetical protein
VCDGDRTPGIIVVIVIADADAGVAGKSAAATYNQDEVDE